MKTVEPTLLALTPRWLVVSKPSGWLAIQGRGAESPVLSDWAKAHFSPIWVVHRLDKMTSGVVLFARTAEDHRRANQWFQKREVKKTYHCIAAGVPPAPVFKIQQPIEDLPSLTQVEVKEQYPAGFFAQVRPHTGRRHQIRIHLSNIGCPIWGDPLYGGSSKIPRVALHSSLLQLPTGESFEASFPEDFLFFLSQLRGQSG
jgi:23S rRNA-/tRNA-specific pseudouridylate synthase